MNRTRRLIGMLLVAVSLTPAAAAQTRLEKVLQDRIDATQDGFWIYNDLAAGIDAAARSDRLLLVTFRCIPCEECVKLDEELMESDPELRKLLNQFVRVRIVTTNGLDLNRFQFDFDQSFAIQIMDSDGTVFARYGTRSDRTEWKGDVSVVGLTRTLEAVLELRNDEAFRVEALKGKQPGKPLFVTPNDAPTLAGRFPKKLEFNEDVVKNCIHCHMVGDAQREFFRSKGEPIPEPVLFQYPHPRVVGLTVDPGSLASIETVQSGSAGDQAQLRPGDRIVSMRGQPIFSTADIQWVLHHAKSPDAIAVDFEREGELATTTLQLNEGWRRADNLEWRATSWPLRRMVTGGLRLSAASPDRRRQLNLDDSSMALEVTHVGQYGKHATAKNAGFQEGDVIVAFDGQTDLMRETELLAYGAQHCLPGQRVNVAFYRGKNRHTLELPMQP